MISKQLAVVAMLGALVSVAVPPAAAHAQVDPADAELSGHDLVAGAHDFADPSTTKSQVPGTPSTDAQYPIYREEVIDRYLNLTCGPGRVVGLIANYRIDGPGQRVFLQQREACVDLPGLASGGAAPLSVDGVLASQIVRKALPTPAVEVSPHVDGLTGLETYLWYADDGASSLQQVDHDGDPSTPPRWGLQVTASPLAPDVGRGCPSVCTSVSERKPPRHPRGNDQATKRRTRWSSTA